MRPIVVQHADLHMLTVDSAMHERVGLDERVAARSGNWSASVFAGHVSTRWRLNSRRYSVSLVVTWPRASARGRERGRYGAGSTIGSRPSMSSTSSRVAAGASTMPFR